MQLNTVVFHQLSHGYGCGYTMVALGIEAQTCGTEKSLMGSKIVQILIILI